MSGMDERVGELEANQSGLVYQQCVCHQVVSAMRRNNISSINAGAMLAVWLPAASHSRQPHDSVLNSQLKAIIM